jgi:hypothetical protein
VIVDYTTWAARHVARLYLPSGTITSVGTDIRHAALVDATLNPNGSVPQYVYLWYQVMYHNRGLVGPTIDSIVIWQSAPGANTLLGYAEPVQPTSGPNLGIASSYIMLSGTAISGPSRQRFKLTFFEAASSSNPQRFSGNVLPVAGNESVWDYLLSVVVTQDGLSPVIVRSTNVGYNRKLARRYGRTIQP